MTEKKRSGRPAILTADDEAIIKELSYTRRMILNYVNGSNPVPDVLKHAVLNLKKTGKIGRVPGWAK